jgi:hypothetical protein
LGLGTLKSKNPDKIINLRGSKLLSEVNFTLSELKALIVLLDGENPALNYVNVSVFKKEGLGKIFFVCGGDLKNPNIGLIIGEQEDNPNLSIHSVKEFLDLEKGI